KSGGEAVAPLDLTEERLAVVGVPHCTGPDREDTLRPKQLRLPSVVHEDVPHAGDRSGEEDAAPIDLLPEPGDRLASHDRFHPTLVDVCDEQACGVRADVDGGDTHALTVIRLLPEYQPGEGQQARRALGASPTASRAPMQLGHVG